MYSVDTGKITSLMIEQKLCGRDLATKAGITPTTASKIIRGVCKSNTKTIGKIAQALGVKGATLILDNAAQSKEMI